MFWCKCILCAAELPQAHDLSLGSPACEGTGGLIEVGFVGQAPTFETLPDLKLSLLLGHPVYVS